MTAITLITAEDLRRIRKLLKLTQKELAKRAGVSQSLIARIENKGVDPRLSTIKKIIEALVKDKEEKTAVDIMHTPVITIDIKDSIRSAVELMKKYNISQIPVLSDKKIIGSIRESTILDNITKKNNQEKIFSRTVYEIMENRFTSVVPTTPLSDIIYYLSQSESAVLVLDKNNLVGIITKIDVILSAINIRIVKE